jgi:hypothetical protein
LFAGFFFQGCYYFLGHDSMFRGLTRSKSNAEYLI